MQSEIFLNFTPEAITRMSNFVLWPAERGWRNVCATGVFVGHAGAKSFKGEKRRLVLRNLGILEARFPEYRFECAAFLKADPLAPARARIEECLAPKSPAVLLVSASASARLAADERARQIASADGRLSCISCVYRDLDATAIFRGAAGSAPQSLAFSVSDPVGIARLRSYLEALDPSAVELFDIQSIPTEILSALLELPAKIHIVLADSRWLCESRTAAGGSCSDLPARGMCKSRLAHSLPGLSADPGIPDRLRIGSPPSCTGRMRLSRWTEWLSLLLALICWSVAVAPCWARPSARPVGRSMTSKMVMGILSPFQSANNRPAIDGAQPAPRSRTRSTRRLSCSDDVSTISRSWRPATFSWPERSRLRNIRERSPSMKLDCSFLRIGQAIFGCWMPWRKLRSYRKHISIGLAGRSSTILAILRWTRGICDERVALQIAAWLRGGSIEDSPQ